MTKNYVQNEEFMQALHDHYDKITKNKREGLDTPQISNKLGRIVYLICDGVSQMRSYRGYSYVEEMKSDAIVDCIKAIQRRNFNIEKYENPFAYFTQIAIWAFKRRINEEKKKRYTLYKHFQETMVLTGELDNTLVEYDNISEYIDVYEQKEAEKKEKADQRKLDRANTIL